VKLLAYKQYINLSFFALIFTENFKSKPGFSNKKPSAGKSRKGPCRTAVWARVRQQRYSAVIALHEQKLGEKMSEPALLVASEVYLKQGIHIGTKFKTKSMEPFIYKTRSDGLSVLNLEEIDKRIKTAVRFLASYEPEEILVCARRESGWKPAVMFKKATGSKAMIGRYTPGIMTNASLRDFVEAKVIIVTDPWTDRNAMDDAIKIGVLIVGLCDTNNITNKLELVIPCNNKGKKSLAIIFWLLAREYQKAKGKISKDDEFEYSLDDFIQE